MPDKKRKFRGNRKNFIDIIRTGQEMNVNVYVVTTKDLNVASRHTLGYQYDFTQKTWKTVHIPLPQVIYNRIPFREDELLTDTKRVIKACLQNPYIRFYNPYFFNKWHLFKWLRDGKKTKLYIPSTRRLTNQIKLLPLIQKHRLLYLKPEKGRAGAGIMRVKYVKNSPQPYNLTIQESKVSQTYKYENLTDLKHKIKQVTGDEEYIVQQGIRLAQFKKRPFDIRVLIQKNGQGKWSLTGIGARVAGDASITTHVPRGGSIDDPAKLLTSAFGKKAATRMMGRIKTASFTIARQIERRSGYLLGEMSMDLGIDHSRKLWFFEANSKPMKFDEVDIRQKSLNKLIEYGIFLASRPPVPLNRKKGR